MKRRKALEQIALGALAMNPNLWLNSATMRKLKSFGLQLSTVTPLMARDFEGTLKLVSEIGYRMVEFSALGFLGRDVQEVKDLLAKYKLQAPVGRVAFDAPADFMTMPRDEQMKIFASQGTMESLQKRIKSSITECKIMGQQYLNIPAILPHVFSDMDQIKNMLQILTESGKFCKEAGILLGYHNHDWEFQPVDGQIPFELMLSELDPDYFTFQIDTYWIRKAGRDLIEMLDKYPGRFSTCHFKDISADGDFEDVGHGEIDFSTFTKKAISQGIKYFFVERDSPPDPLNSIKRSGAYLKGMNF